MNDHTRERRLKWQSDTTMGWLLMAVYWVAGFCVGIWWGYIIPRRDTMTAIHELVQKQQVTVWHVAALGVTLLAHFVNKKRTGNFGRARNWPAIVVFAVCNGVCETMLFLASYDIGRELVKLVDLELLPFKVSATNIDSASAIVGVLTFTAYSAFIHAAFWLPHGLPRHILPTAKPFETSGLPALMAMSASWFGLHHVFDDIAAVCILHIILNVFTGISIHIPPLPSLTKKHQS